MHTINNFLLHPIMLAIAALLGLGIGGVLAVDVPAYYGRAARAEGLLPLGAAALADAPPGREVLIEGRIDESAEPLYSDLVLYVREEYRSAWSPLGGEESPRWHEVERATPPLPVATAGGVVLIRNDDYTLDTTAVTLREAEPTLTEGARQARGYAAGSAIMAIGTAAATEEAALTAEFVYAGTRESYIAEMRRVAWASLQIASPALLIGIAAAVGFFRRLPQFLNEEPPTTG
jgi:hypothetical protein